MYGCLVVTLVQIPVVYGDEVNVVEYEAIEVRQLAGFQESNVEQHGSVEGSGHILKRSEIRL